VKRSDYVVGFVIVAGLVFGGFLLVSIGLERAEKRHRCEARGGTWFCSDYSCVCLAKTLVLP
jgi:hypothetical protein